MQTKAIFSVYFHDMQILKNGWQFGGLFSAWIHFSISKWEGKNPNAGHAGYAIVNLGVHNLPATVKTDLANR
jgi:hypothetical protein